MNKYDERYDIRLAKLEDIPDIMQFINDYWKKGHILSVDRELFEYEFVYNDQVNFTLALDKITHSIEGILGYLNTSNPENEKAKDIWGSIWKVKEGNIPFLGIEILKRMKILTQCRMELGSGVNPKTAAPILRKVFKDTVSKMQHFYLLNKTFEEFNVAKIYSICKIPYIVNDVVEIKTVSDAEELQKFFNVNVLQDKLPYKDLWYVNKRFYQHPYYDYKVYSLKKYEDSLCSAILITKEIHVKNNKILRIVDYLGDRMLFQYLGEYLTDLIIKERYEYIDFYVFGFEKQYIVNSGFKLKDENDTNIIPNYFEPFERKNVDIWVNYPSRYKQVQFFKADADQDRPNMIK